MFQRSKEYLAALPEDRLVRAIELNAARLATATEGTEPFATSKERLAVFVPEALRRKLVISAETLELLGDNHA